MPPCAARRGTISPLRADSFDASFGWRRAQRRHRSPVRRREFRPLGANRRPIALRASAAASIRSYLPLPGSATISPTMPSDDQPEKVWDEHDWERFLQQQDRKTEKYME